MDHIENLSCSLEDGGINVKIFGIVSYIQINMHALKLINKGKVICFKKKINRRVKVKVPQKISFHRFRTQFWEITSISTTKWTTNNHDPIFVNGFCTFIIAINDISLEKIEAAGKTFKWNDGEITFEIIH